MLLSLQRVNHLNMFFDCRHFAPYQWSRELQLFRFDSFHCGGSREYNRLNGELFQHVPQRVPIGHQFLNTEQYRTLPSHQSALVYERKRPATMVCFFDADSILERKQPQLLCLSQLLALKELSKILKLCTMNTDRNNTKICCKRKISEAKCTELLFRSTTNVNWKEENVRLQELIIQYRSTSVSKLSNAEHVGCCFRLGSIVFVHRD